MDNDMKVLCACKRKDVAMELHELGIPNCTREIVPKDQEPKGSWDVGLLYTADPEVHKQLYFKHPCGRWSRLKGE